MSVAHKLSSHSPGLEGWRGGASARVSELLDRGIVEGVISGGVVLAAQFGRFTVQLSRGTKTPTEEGSVPDQVSFATVFDLGTLTEVVCTATLLMRLLSSGKIGILDRASRFVPSLAVGAKSSITLAHLLAHASGLGPAVTVYDDLARAHAGPRPGILASSSSRQFAYQSLHKMVPRYEPGSKQVRSDANYLLLGEVCEIVTGMPLEKAFSRLIAAPLDVRSLNYIDQGMVRSKNLRPQTEIFAAVGVCPRRSRLMCGEVWDEHAWAMGGVAGHNGLFGTADDLLIWAAEILAAFKGRSDIIRKEVAQQFLAPTVDGFDPKWRFGFEGLADCEQAVQVGVAPEAVVVSSATGCSVIIEPKRDLVAVVMTSGGVRSGNSKRLAALRSEIQLAMVESE